MPTAITSRLSRGTGNLSPFALAWEEDLRVSYTTVDTLAARDLIPEWARRAKMVCYVVESNTTYRLGLNVTIAGQVWTEEDYGVPTDVVLETELFDTEGFIKSELIKNIVLNSSYVVDDEASMLALTTLMGNFVLRVDTGTVFIKLNNDDPSDITDFAEVVSSNDVLSVNGNIGHVVLTLQDLYDANPGAFEDLVSNVPVISDLISTVNNFSGDITSLENELALKADLVSGTVPLAQLPYSFGGGIQLTGNDVVLGGDILETVLDGNDVSGFALVNLTDLLFTVSTGFSLVFDDTVNTIEVSLNGTGGLIYSEDLVSEFVNNSLISKKYADTFVLGQQLGDANQDAIIFWDDSAGHAAYLTLGTNLSITGTVLNASGGGGGVSFWGDLTGDITDQTDLVDYVADQLATALVEVVPGTTYTFSAADSGKIKVFTSVTGCIADFDAGLPSSFYVDCYCANNAGNLDFTFDVTYTYEGSGTTISEGQAASFFFRTATTLVGIVGDGSGGGGSYTDEQAQDAIGTILVDSATIDFTYNDATPSITASVINDSITFAKLQNINQFELIGRTASGSGDARGIPLGRGLNISSTDGSLILGEDDSDYDADGIIRFQSPVSLNLLHVGDTFGVLPEPNNIVLARFTTIANFPNDRFAIVLPRGDGDASEMNDNVGLPSEAGMFCYNPVDSVTDGTLRPLFYTGTEWKGLAFVEGGATKIAYVFSAFNPISDPVATNGINFGPEFILNLDTNVDPDDTVTIHLGGNIDESVSWQGNGAGAGFIFGDGSSDLGRFEVRVDATQEVGGRILITESSSNNLLEITDELIRIQAVGGLGPYDIFSIDATSGQLTINTSATLLPGLLADPTVEKILAVTSGDILRYIDIDDIGGGPILPEVDPLTTGTTVTATGIERVFTGDTTGGTFTTVLPTAVGREGYKFTFKKIGGSADWVLDGNGSELLEQALTATITINNTAVTFVSDGANWIII